MMRLSIKSEDANRGQTSWSGIVEDKDSKGFSIHRTPQKTGGVQRLRKGMKLLYGAVVLACAPFVVAGNDAVYPTEKVAAFVFEKVDVTSLPSSIRRNR